MPKNTDLNHYLDAEDFSTIYQQTIAIFFFELDDADYYKKGGEVKSKNTIVNKIGFPEETADYFIEQGGKFAVWLANATLQKSLEEWSMSKDDFLKSNEAKKHYIRVNYGGAIREILDWLKHPYTPQQNLRELTFDEALEKSREWHEQLETLGGDVDYVEPTENEILIEYPETPDGRKYYWVRIPLSYCDVESRRMGHCGRTGQGNELISLRSINPFGTGHTVNESHVTIAYNPYDEKIVQAKGKKNQKPSEKYHGYIYDLILLLAEKGRFKGFSAEYQSSDDYGWDDMSKTEIETLYKKDPDIFDNFSGQYILWDNKIIDTPPTTILSVRFDVDELKDMVSISRDISDDFIEWVLGGDLDFDYGSWDYYYKNAEDYIDELNEKNYEDVIDKIAEITELDRGLIKQNGAKYYLSGEDENFDEDLFDDIRRSVARAYTNAEGHAYYKYYKKQIQSALEEIGTVYQLNDEGASRGIDLADKLSHAEIQGYMDSLGDEDLRGVFREALYDGSIEKGDLFLDNRYMPNISNHDFNSCFEIESYAKGGKIDSRVKNLLSKLQEAHMDMNNDKFDSISNEIHEISDNQGLNEEEYKAWDDLRSLNNEQRLEAYFKNKNK